MNAVGGSASGGGGGGGNGVGGAPPPLTLSKVLECPVCATHGRNAQSGEALFPTEPGMLLRALKQCAPQRHAPADEVAKQWGAWHTGGTFGVYLSLHHNGINCGGDGSGRVLRLSEGDVLEVEESTTRCLT